MSRLGISYFITHIKQPAEVLPIDIGFGKLHILPRGSSKIVSAEVSAKRWQRKFPDDVEIVDAQDFFVTKEDPSKADVKILTPNNTTVRFSVKGGESGYDYEVTLLVTFDNGAKLEEEVFVRVRD
jgi:hypothetical protein